jgi:tRNA wybutosine-synthesizing protein 3
MAIDKFNKRKIDVLRRKDKSQKQGIDKEILSIVNLINSKEDYFTTSSCSGRIVVIAVGEGNRKEGSKWIYSNHQPLAFLDVWQSIDPTNNSFEERFFDGEVWFKQEPMILHVCCRDIQSANSLWRIAREVGYKRGGITAGKDWYNLEMIGSEFIETLIAKDKKLLVDKEYVDIIVKVGNERMNNSRKRMDNFLKILKNGL